MTFVEIALTYIFSELKNEIYITPYTQTTNLPVGGMPLAFIADSPL